MVVRVLGPLETGSGPLSPRERAILSALIVRLGVAMSPSQLADACWSENTPSTWEQQIRNSIARIRGRLGTSSVVTVGSTYRLGLDADQIDAGQFERLVSTARGHMLREDADRAVDAYQRALSLWRGAPLPDVAGWEPGAVEAMRLNEIRASAEEELLDARLAAGEGRAVIADAERLLREDPLRESRWAILALANYRADRQADALALLRAARERLAEELGVEPGPRLAGLEVAILRRDPALDARSPATRADTACPYPGLRAFGPEDAELYFGREGDVDVVLDRLAPRTVTAIAGASGTGKSSLLLAGVIPRLRTRGTNVEIVRPGSDGAPGLQRAASRAAVVAIDQGEELLAAAPEDIARFADAMRAFLDDGGSILLTVRSDALDRVRALPAVGDAIGLGVYLLGPLSDTAFRAAIEEPARKAGLRLEPGLVELATRDGGDRSSTLPHLSHAMQATWTRREGTTLTVDGYRESGGIAGAIAQSAEEAFRGLSPEDQLVCRSLLLRLVTRGVDGASTRRRAPLAPLLSDPDRRRVIEALTAARLIAVDDDAVTVAHEAVATAWPRLDAWLEEDADGARVFLAIESAAVAWDAGGRSEDDLLRGSRLHSAVEWRERARPDLTPTEVEFLDACQDRESVEVRELAARAARERRRNRTLRTALAGSALLLVVALVAGGVAVVRGQESALSAENARIEALVATALGLRATDREVGALLAAEAFRRWPDDGRVRSALMGTMTGAGGLIDIHRADGRYSTLAMIPGTVTALRVTDSLPDEDSPQRAGESRVDIVNVSDGDVVRTLEVELPQLDPQFLRNVEVSRDGGVAVIQTGRLVDASDPNTCCWNHVAFLDLETGAALPGSQLLRMRTSTIIDLGETGDVAYIAHPITGDLVAVDTRNGAVRVSGPGALEDFTGEGGIYNSVVVIDEKRVATGTGDRLQVFDRRSLAPLQSVSLGANLASEAIVLDGDGGLLTSGRDGSARIDLRDGTVAWTRLTRPAEQCIFLALTPIGTVACSTWGAVVELDRTTGVPTGRVLETQLDTAAELDVIDDHTLLVAAAWDALWMRWSIAGAGPATRVLAQGRQMFGSPDEGGERVVTVPSGVDPDDPGPSLLWNLTTDSPVGAPVDGMTLLGGGILEVYNADTGLHLENLTTGERHDYDVPGFSLMDSQLVTGDWGPHVFAQLDGVVIAVDPTTGRQEGAEMILNTGQQVALQSASEAADGRRVALTWLDLSDNRTQTSVFDLQTGEEIVRGLPDRDQTLIVGPDELIAVGTEVAERVELSTLEPRGNVSRSAGGSRLVMASLDHRTMLNVGQSNSLTLYDLASNVVLGDPIDTDGLAAHGGYLTADGQRLITTASPDGIAVWDLDPEAQAAAACRLAAREFTASEWSTYFPGEPHQQTCALLTAP